MAGVKGRDIEDDAVDAEAGDEKVFTDDDQN